MPEGPDGKTIIIVKKGGGHEGHHGGAWKVAFADFMTAMMALFLVLWLVNSASNATKDSIGRFFSGESEGVIFSQGTGTPLERGGGGFFDKPYKHPGRDIDDQRIYRMEEPRGFHKDSGILEPREDILDSGEAKNPSASGSSSSWEDDLGLDEDRLGQLASELAQKLESSIAANSQNISARLGKIELTADIHGLHLEIMDTDKTSMFSSGNANFNPAAEGELEKLAVILAELPNPIDVEGHTDAIPFGAHKRASYDNFDLSTDRANAARRVLQRVGLKSGQIKRVVGYAANKPKLTDNPRDPSNRRITITMRFSKEAADVFKKSPFVRSERGFFIEDKSPWPKDKILESKAKTLKKSQDPLSAALEDL